MGMGPYAPKNSPAQDMDYNSEDYYENQAGGSMTSRGSKLPRPPSYGKLRYPGKNKVPGNDMKDKY